MNQKQREYLMERVRNIRTDKIKAAEIKHIKEVRGAPKRDRERWQLVLAGKVKPRKDFKADSWNRRSDYHLDQIFDFSKYQDTVDQKALDRDCARINAEAQRVRDMAMLGDCEQATKLLAGFEKF